MNISKLLLMLSSAFLENPPHLKGTAAATAGAYDLLSTTDSAHPPVYSRPVSRHRFSTMDSPWRNPSRALAAGLTYPRRSISTWAHLGPRPTIQNIGRVWCTTLVV
ncbi:hypothetical protein P7K49_029615 [Saguinus oedipus]|uniref:Secreted protein n=1 Tax=Saguinus oedipus TaxID=9490 RepID=A0ABQ9U7Q2_SAGOE|nr:hypothetical protein P7K49_029615 [Saguinus oedipus]